MRHDRIDTYSPKETLAMAEFQASRFAGIRTLNFVYNLRKSRRVEDSDILLGSNKAAAIARLFRGKLNQQLFGNRYRRFGQELPVTIYLHTCPNMHLHGHIGLKDGVSELRVRSFCQTFALKHPWIDGNPYIQQTESEIGTEIYNSRFGADSLVVF